MGEVKQSECIMYMYDLPKNKVNENKILHSRLMRWLSVYTDTELAVHRYRTKVKSSALIL